MRVLVTGVKGQLGFDVVKELEKRGHTAIGVDVEEMDITDTMAVEQMITHTMTDAVVHCAAYTAVDAEEDNQGVCYKVNVEGTENIAKVCKKCDIKMIYISTDYVFDGKGTRPWEPDDTITEPLNTYGMSKYQGEQVVRKYLEKFYIVRIAWVFGVNGKNFVKTMLRLGEENGAVKVVNDQFGSPTYTADLAVLLVDMVEVNRFGIYHATNEGFCSWYDFACEIFKAANMQVEVTPVSAEEFPAKAKRPENSRMSKDKLDINGFRRLPSWQNATARYVKELKKQK